MNSNSPNEFADGPQTRRAALRFTGWVLLLAAALPGAAVAQPPPDRGALVQVDDLYRFDQPTAPVMSPDGRYVAYVRQWIDPQTKDERNSLWLVDAETKAVRPLESGEPDARGPVFSPDGRWLAFRSTRARGDGLPPIPATPPASDVATDLWLVRLEDGLVLPLVAGPRAYGRVFGDPFYGRVSFSPSGKKLVFVADDGKDPRGADELAAGVSIVRADQGEGYTGYGVAAVWVADLDLANGRQASSRVRPITRGDAWYGDPQWLPDEKSIVVHANRTQDREAVRFSINKNYDLWQIDLDGGRMRQLTFGPGPEVSPRIALDGLQLVCLSSPRKGPHADVYNLALVDLKAEPPTTRILFDHHRLPAPDAPHPYATFPLPDPSWDDERHFLYTAPQGVDTLTVRLDTVSAQGAVLKPDSAEASGSRLWKMQSQRGALLPKGNRFLAERTLGTTTVVRWRGRDGLELEGLLTTPPKSVAQAPYKLLLHPHGGPHSRSTMGFNFTVEVFAAQGYAVFQPNFRGSQGYGRKFLDADRADFGGGDMQDILAGIDYLVDQGTVDRRRQFVYGVSYGGFMTSWLVGHTNQFQAAVAQNAVTDLSMMWQLSDIQSWIEWEFGGRPWEVPDQLRAHSPITFVDRVTTPTLVLHSRDDRRCPLPMGLAYYRALERREVPTTLVIYPDEGHGIRQPKHREDVLRRVLAWFEK